MKTFFSSVFCFVCAISTYAQSSAFTYQGRLNLNGSAANGTYDLRFTIYDAVTNGGPASSTLTNAATSVSNGLFTVPLDFGTNAFSGADRWLEIAVRTNGATTFTVLSPRQPITSTPYAMRTLAANSVTGPVSAALLSGTISSSNIGNNSIDASKLAAGSVTSSELASGSVTTSALADGAVTGAKLVSTQGTGVSATLNNPSPATVNYFGTSAAPLGSDRVIVGSHAKAYIFSSTGSLLTTINNPTSGNDDFGSAVAAAQSWVVVGAPLDFVVSSPAGSAHIISTNGTLIRSINNPAPGSADQFGASVAAVGSDRVLIGAYLDDLGVVDSGTVYLFSTNGTLITTFTNPAPAADSHFGQSIAALGTTKVLIGAPGSEAAYIFSTNGTLLNTLTSAYAGGGFGATVAVAGPDKVLIGSPYNGFAYLMSTNGTTLGMFINSNFAYGQFSHAMAPIGTDKVLISAPTSGGAAFIYATNGTLLTTITNPPGGSSGFGSAVAVVDDKLFVGADSDSSFVGIAYLFSTFTYAGGVISEGVRVGGITQEMFATGAVDSTAILDGTIVNADIAANAAISDTKLATINTTGKVANSATTATSANTGNAIVARDASGNFSAGTITANGSALTSLNASALASGTVSDARLSTNVALLNGSPTFNSQLSTSAGLRLNNTNIWLRANTDVNHGLGWFGSGKAFANATPDGPVLFGYDGGLLGTMNGGQKIALSWDSSEHVGIGMTNPVAQLHVSGPGGDSNPQAWLNQETGTDYARLRLTVTNHFSHRWDIGSISNRFAIYSGFFGANMLLLDSSGLTVRGTFVSSSDRNAKENISRISPREILDKVAALPINAWNYKDSPETRHVGPMAQDFYSAFGLGTDDKHISMVDADGVALAAIQGLNEKLVEKDSELKRLREQNQKLEERLQRLERFLSRESQATGSRLD